MTTSTSRKIVSIAIEMLQRTYFGPFQAGIVIAGFGENDYMPRLVAYSVEGMVLNRPRIRQTNEEAISDEGAAAIIPFAQQEMVHSFLRGIDPSMSTFMRESTNNLFTGVIEKILEVVQKVDPHLGKSLKAAIDPQTKRLLGSLFKEWDERSRDYWSPIVQIAASLPKDELASMAEALVNLTKFRRRISAERETVGGPIDVAIITKGDGFVWVKRKHYFDPALNPRVIARYGKEGR